MKVKNIMIQLTLIFNFFYDLFFILLSETINMVGVPGQR